MQTNLDNVRRVFDLADPHDLRDGLLAYPRHQKTLRALSEYYGTPYLGTVASFAALSPNNAYIGNLRSVVSLLQGFRDGLPIEALTVSTYKACATRGWRCLQGEDFLSFTKGKKTRAFYQNILDPNDPLPVTVDGHMMSVWFGQYMTMKEAVRKRLKYEAIADDIRLVAQETGFVPCRMQSVLWFTWKRMHNVLYQAQVDLLKVDDPWLLDLEPRDICGYSGPAFNPVLGRGRKIVAEVTRVRSQYSFAY